MAREILRSNHCEPACGEWRPRLSEECRVYDDFLCRYLINRHGTL